MPDPVPGEGRADRREREAQERERAERERLAANRARRGDPQRFMLRGMKHVGSGEDSGMRLEEIDPPLELNERIAVVEASALAAAEARAVEATRELEIVGNFLAAGRFTDERVKVLRRRVDAILAKLAPDV